MTVVTAALQFIVGTLTVGLGLFLVAWAIRDLYRGRLLPSVSARTVTALGGELSARTATALGGALLLAAGAYSAHLAVPL